MVIALPPEIQAIVEAKVAAGEYPDANAVIAEAFRLLDEAQREARFYAEVQVGLEQMRRGEVTEWTPATMAALVRRADEEERAGKPIRDAVRP